MAAGTLIPTPADGLRVRVAFRNIVYATRIAYVGKHVFDFAAGWYENSYMKVLLINPGANTTASAGSYKRFLAPMPPISIAYVAAALEASCIDVDFYDDYTSSTGRHGLMDYIEHCDADILGLSCVTVTAGRTYEIAEEIRSRFPEKKIIMGNIHPSVFHKEILADNLADAIVLGEGELTVTELVRAFEGEKAFEDVKGIAWRDNGDVRVNAPQDFVANLDELPFPAWHLFPIGKYRIFNFARVREPGALVLGSRGCPYNCTFCSLKIMGRRRRRRTAASIADEFEYLHDRFGYVQMSFIDPMFPYSKREALTFSEEIISRGLQKKMCWITETRVDHVDEEMLVAMRKSGLRRIMYGFESGSQQNIDTMEKNFTMDQARQAVEATQRAGIQIIGFFILGAPGETVNSMDQTINYAASLNIDFAKFTVFSPFPGTKVYDDMVRDNVIEKTDRWERFTNYPSKEIEAIYVPEAVSNEDLVRMQKKAFLKFYLRPGMILRHILSIRTLGLRDILDGVLTLLKK